MQRKNTDCIDKSTGFVFNLFCLWTFVLLCRPQDLFTFLAPLRPALVTTALVFITVIVFHKNLPGAPLFQSRQIKHYLILYVVMILGIPFSLYAGLSFEIVITKYIVTVLFVCIFFKLISSIKRINKVLLVSCLGSGLYFFLALRDFVPGTGRLAYGSMFDANDLAFFALGFLPLNLLFLSKDNPLWVRLPCLITFLSGLLLILFTGSRGGFLGLLVSVLVLLFFTKKTLNRTLKTFFVVICAIIFIIAPINTERYKTFFSLEQDYNVQSETGRFRIWEIGVRALINNPITGVGVGCFANAVGVDRQQRGLEVARWQTAHNSIIQLGTETGFIGLMLYLTLSLNVIRIFLRAMKKGTRERLTRIGEMGLVGFSGMFVAGMFLSQAYSMYWAFYLTLSAALSQQLINETQVLEEQGAKLEISKSSKP